MGIFQFFSAHSKPSSPFLSFPTTNSLGLLQQFHLSIFFPSPENSLKLYSPERDANNSHFSDSFQQGAISEAALLLISLRAGLCIAHYPPATACETGTEINRGSAWRLAFAGCPEQQSHVVYLQVYQIRTEIS